MRRVKVVGPLMVMAAFLLGAMASSSASAGTYYWCKAIKKGEYTNSTCTTKSFKHEKGKYELTPVATCEAQKKGEYTNRTCTTKSSKPKKGKYDKTKLRGYASTGGKAELATPAFGPGKVICRANTVKGEITGATTDVDRVTFTGCEFEGLPCKSEGPNSTPSGTSGVIETNLLDGRLVDNPETITFLNAETNKEETKGPAVGEVWEELKSSEHEPYWSQFNCGGVVYLRTTGQDTGVFTASTVNHLSTTGGLEFKAGIGADGLLAEVLTEAGWQGPAPSIEEAGTAVITNEAAIEVRAPAVPRVEQVTFPLRRSPNRPPPRNRIRTDRTRRRRRVVQTDRRRQGSALRRRTGSRRSRGTPESGGRTRRDHRSRGVTVSVVGIGLRRRNDQELASRRARRA